MIALLKHKGINMLGKHNDFHGISIVEVKLSPSSLFYSLSKTIRAFNEGIKKYEVTKIYYQWGSKNSIKEINNILVLNKNTLIFDRKEIIRILLEDNKFIVKWQEKCQVFSLAYELPQLYINYRNLSLFKLH